MEENKLVKTIADAIAGGIQAEAQHGTCDKRDAHQALRAANPSWKRAQATDEWERTDSSSSY
jgi:hypothetical protein